MFLKDFGHPVVSRYVPRVYVHNNFGRNHVHFKFRGVNDAFYGLVKGIAKGEIPTVRSPSRVGDVLQIVEPVIVTYENPRQRVLFNQSRDANPFFHLFESLWMLAGRNDVDPLRYYASGIADIASDDGLTFNGAYGYRWRNAPQMENGRPSEGDMCFVSPVDQLKCLISHLKAKPESRRAVLQMWNVEDDLLKIDVTKDVCCNLSVMFSIRQVTEVDKEAIRFVRDEVGEPVVNVYKFLDMTVTNRSNDMIWGMLGANVVHFSFLQEYMANCLGVEVGVYNQISNNLHVYVENNGGFKPDEWLGWYDGSDVAEDYQEPAWYPKPYVHKLVSNQAKFDEECVKFVTFNQEAAIVEEYRWEEPFLKCVAQPLCNTFHAHKMRLYKVALAFCETIEADDWRIAATNWIAKRQANWEAKQKDGE